MTYREKIAIALLLGMIFVLYVTRIFVEQILVSDGVDAYNTNLESEKVAVENQELRTQIITESALWKIRERAQGFVPASGWVVIH